MKRLLVLIAVALMLGGCVVYDTGYYDRGYYPYGYVAPSVGIFFSDSHGGHVFRGHHGGFRGGHGGHHHGGGFRR
jgi:hypothetical protein